jgi:hypothetical protein
MCDSSIANGSNRSSPSSPQNPVYTQLANVQSTSKYRMKVSSYSTGFFNTFQHGKADDVWDETTASGATVTWVSTKSSVQCLVTSTVGSKAIRQTKNVMRYIPGRPAEFSTAYFWGTPVSGIRKRIGQFDENDGFFLEQDATGEYYCVIRSSATGSIVENRVARSSWNGDKLDGSGPSGVILNKNTTQVMVVDYEWYGAGAVKFSFVIGDKTIIIHTFYSANILTTPWCSTPFIPMRVEIENVSSVLGDSMFHFSQCHSSEGASDNLGTPVSISTPITGITLTAANTFYPVLSIRLKTTNGALHAVVIPQTLQEGTLDNTFVFFRLVLNPTLTGANWTNHPTAESSVQYDVSSTAFTGGTIIEQGFTAPGANNVLLLNRDQTGNFQLGRTILGTDSDILTIVMAATNANKAAIAVLGWIEQR